MDTDQSSSPSEISRATIYVVVAKQIGTDQQMIQIGSDGRVRSRNSVQFGIIGVDVKKYWPLFAAEMFLIVPIDDIFKDMVVHVRWLSAETAPLPLSNPLAT